MRKTTRERQDQKCAFLMWAPPCLHHHIWSLLCLYLSHLKYVNHALPFYLTIFSSTAWVPHTLTFPSTFLIHLWIYMFYDFTIWCYFASLSKCSTNLIKLLIFSPLPPLTHGKIPCHMCLTLTITMPPRIGALPPNFPPESSFPLLLRRT